MCRREHVELLMSKAAADEAALDILMQHDDAPVESMGFHAQQAAEKLFKAAITAAGVDYPYTHVIDFLLRLLRRQGVGVPEALLELRRLTPFAAHLRYESLDEGEDIVLDATTVRQLIRDLRTWVEAYVADTCHEGDAT